MKQKLFKKGLSEGFPAVLPPILGVDLLEVISSGPNVVKGSGGGILPSVVVLLPQQHGVDVLLTGHDLHALQPVDEIQLPFDLGRVALDGHGVEGGSETGTVGEHGDRLAFQVFRFDAREERGEATVQRGGVHVAATLGAPHRRSHAFGVLVPSSGDELLLDRLVGQRGFVVDTEEVLGDLGELWMIRVGQEIVVEESAVTFLDHLSVWRVEDGVMDRFEVEVDAFLCDFGTVRFVRAVESLDVAGDRERSVDHRVFGIELGLVEIIRVGHVISVDGCKARTHTHT